MSAAASVQPGQTYRWMGADVHVDEVTAAAALVTIRQHGCRDWRKWTPLPFPVEAELINPPISVETQLTGVRYHGRRFAPGQDAVIVETGTGVALGPLPHVVKHSPTGMAWGFAGSGPADLARSLLIHALGEHAECQTCQGTRKVTRLEGDAKPRPQADLLEPADPCADCDDGYRQLPYQDFKAEFVAAWGDEWWCDRAQVLAWLAERGITSAPDDEHACPVGDPSCEGAAQLDQPASHDACEAPS